MRHNMDILAETYLKYTPQPIETLIGKKGKNQKSMRDVELEEIKEYAVEDADVTLQLKEILTLELDKTGTKKLFEEIKSTQDVLKGFAVVPCAFRPPAGITNPKLGPILCQLGLSCVTFSCRGFDGGNRRIKGLAEKILKKVKQ